MFGAPAPNSEQCQGNLSTLCFFRRQGCWRKSHDVLGCLIWTVMILL